MWRGLRRFKPRGVWCSAPSASGRFRARSRSDHSDWPATSRPTWPCTAGWTRRSTRIRSAHYPFWQTVRMQARVAGAGEALPFGAMGENLTIEGLLESDLWIGDRLELPECAFAVSAPRMPCFKFAAAMGFRQAPQLMLQSGYCGAYLTVVRPGFVNAGGESPTVQGSGDRQYHHSTAAVMAISAMPPGALLSTEVAGCKPVSRETSARSPSTVRSCQACRWHIAPYCATGWRRRLARRPRAVRPSAEWPDHPGQRHMQAYTGPRGQRTR